MNKVDVIKVLAEDKTFENETKHKGDNDLDVKINATTTSIIVYNSHFVLLYLLKLPFVLQVYLHLL